MVKGKETVAIKSCTGTKLISDVMYVPDINQNLLSVGQLVEKSFSVIFKKKQCLIKDANNDEVFKIKMRNKSFSLDPMEEKQTDYPVVGNNAEIWNKRLGHFHHTTILNIQRKALVHGIPHLESELPPARLVNMANKQDSHSKNLPEEQQRSYNSSTPILLDLKELLH